MKTIKGIKEELKLLNGILKKIQNGENINVHVIERCLNIIQEPIENTVIRGLPETKIPQNLLDEREKKIGEVYIKLAEIDSENEKPKPAEKKDTSFRSIIQYDDPDKLLKRLHQLIDKRSGADVGCVLLKAYQENYIGRKPTKKEFTSEFELIGSWTAITNYLNENSLKALARANRIVIFE